MDSDMVRLYVKNGAEPFTVLQVDCSGYCCGLGEQKYASMLTFLTSVSRAK